MQIITANDQRKAAEMVEVSRKAAEIAIDLKARLEIKLDLQEKYTESLKKSIALLKSKPPEIVEVPVTVELVPENVRKRMVDLSKENRILQRRVEQLEMILSADGRELLLPENL